MTPLTMGPEYHLAILCHCGQPVLISFCGEDLRFCPCGRGISYDTESVVIYAPDRQWRRSPEPPHWLGPVPLDLGEDEA